MFIAQAFFLLERGHTGKHTQVTDATDHPSHHGSAIYRRRGKGCVATPRGREWTRPLRVLAVPCPLQTSPITQPPQVRYIHTTVPHSPIYITLCCPMPRIKILPFPLGIATSTGKNHPWAYPTHHPQQHLHSLNRHSTKHRTDRQTDRPTDRQTRVSMLAKQRRDYVLTHVRFYLQALRFKSSIFFIRGLQQLV